MNPQRKAAPGFCEINTETMKATIAMLHQGKYKQAKKLKSKIRSKDAINFIIEGIFFLSCMLSCFIFLNELLILSLNSTLNFEYNRCLTSGTDSYHAIN